MREPDVRLTDDERASFAELARLLTAPAPPGRHFRSWSTRRRVVLTWTTAAVAGGILLIAGLTADAPAMGAAGFLLAAIGVARSTRRLTWAWVVLRWRRRSSPPAEHMWEP